MWGSVTVVLIVGVSVAMPGSGSKSIDFVHVAFLTLVALGPQFDLKTDPTLNEPCAISMLHLLNYLTVVLLVWVTSRCSVSSNWQPGLQALSKLL